jgi:hypothetical protein
MTPRSLTAATLSFAAAVAFLILLAALHVVKRDMDPSWNMISQYENGRFGWIMQVAFLCIALSCVSLVVAIWSQVPTIAGRIGLALLLVAAAGMTIAAFNIPDPVTTPKAEMTAHGNLHGLGFALGVPSQTIAAILISLSLRRNSAWASSRRALLWTAQLPWVGLVATLATVIVLLPRHGGKFGPGVFVGFPNRLYIVACCVWLMTAAWGALRLRSIELHVEAAAAPQRATPESVGRRSSPRTRATLSASSTNLADSTFSSTKPSFGHPLEPAIAHPRVPGTVSL